MLNRALNLVVEPEDYDIHGFDGFDWTFGLGSKAKKAKAKAKEEKRETLLQQRAENQAERRLSEQRQIVIQQRKAEAGKAMLVGGTILGLALVGAVAYATTRKRKKRR